HQHLAGRRKLESTLDDLLELFLVVGDATAATTKGETGADDGRVAYRGLDLDRLLEGPVDGRLRTLQADLRHRDAEQLAVLGHPDRIARRTDQLDAVLLQHAVVSQVERAVERGLATHGGQQRVGLFLGDDLLDRLPVDRLDVDGVGHLRGGHDRGRVAVDPHHPVPLVAQGLAGLCAGIVELAGLADDDRAGPDDQDGLDVGALGHVNAPLRAGCFSWIRRTGRTAVPRRAGRDWLPGAPGS